MFGLGLMMLALLIAFGCSSDEDCPTCPSGDVDTVTITETITDTVFSGGTDTLVDTLTDTVTLLDQFPAYIEAYVQDECGRGVFQARVHPNGLVIDSFQVGDSICYDVGNNTGWDESDQYQTLYLRDDAPIFQRFDTATVTIWSDNLSATAGVRVLNPCQDYPVFVVPSSGDTIETVQSQ